jgi:hypothetical protein
LVAVEAQRTVQGLGVAARGRLMEVAWGLDVAAACQAAIPEDFCGVFEDPDGNHVEDEVEYTRLSLISLQAVCHKSGTRCLRDWKVLIKNDPIVTVETSSDGRDATNRSQH